MAEENKMQEIKEEMLEDVSGGRSSRDYRPVTVYEDDHVLVQVGYEQYTFARFFQLEFKSSFSVLVIFDPNGTPVLQNSVFAEGGTCDGTAKLTNSGSYLLVYDTADKTHLETRFQVSI